MVGEFGETIVIDWGIAKVLNEVDIHATDIKTTVKAAKQGDTLSLAKTMYGQAMGSPYYMPPEQAAGQLDRVGPRSDVYSLGATLFAILTGRAPFGGASAAETLEQVRRGAFAAPSAVNADCPKPLEAIALRAMALDPDIPPGRQRIALRLSGPAEPGWRWRATNQCPTHGRSKIADSSSRNWSAPTQSISQCSGNCSMT